MESWDLVRLDVQPRKPRVLRTDREARLIAIQLLEGDRLHDHQTYERGYLIVIKGQIEVTGGGETLSGEAGFIAEFDPRERREISATKDSRLLLMLGPWPGEGHSSEKSRARSEEFEERKRKEEEDDDNGDDDGS